MAITITNIFTVQTGTYDLLTEDGGVYQVTTTNTGIFIGVVNAGPLDTGNCDLVTLQGTVLPIVVGVSVLAPNRLFGVAGGGSVLVNVCVLGVGIRTISGTGGT